MLITNQFTSTIIAAYENHNKDEHALGEEMISTHLVCRGNRVLVVRHAPTPHVGIFCSRAKVNFKTVHQLFYHVVQQSFILGYRQI